MAASLREPGEEDSLRRPGEWIHALVERVGERAWGATIGRRHRDPAVRGVEWRALHGGREGNLPAVGRPDGRAIRPFQRDDLLCAVVREREHVDVGGARLNEIGSRRRRECDARAIAVRRAATPLHPSDRRLHGRRDVQRPEVHIAVVAVHDLEFGECLLAFLRVGRRLGRCERDRSSVARPAVALDAVVAPGELNRLSSVRPDREDLRFVVDACRRERDPLAVRRPTRLRR